MTMLGWPIDLDGFNGDGKSVSSSSNTEESDEESWSVSSVVDLEPGFQASKVCQQKLYFTQYNADCDIDIIDRSYNTSGKTNTLKIHIPATVDKCQCRTDNS